MKKAEILEIIEIEGRRLKKRSPAFPDHICAQSGEVTIMAGRLQSMAHRLKYDDLTDDAIIVLRSALIRQAAAVAAVAIRFIKHNSKPQSKNESAIHQFRDIQPDQPGAVDGPEQEGLRMAPVRQDDQHDASSGDRDNGTSQPDQ